MKIYLIAVIENINENEYFPIFNSRTIGYFSTLEEAKAIVETNCCDIHETCYKYAVIEEVTDGLYTSFNSSSFWYEWKNNKYVSIDRPKEAENQFGFTIG